MSDSFVLFFVFLLLKSVIGLSDELGNVFL